MVENPTDERRRTEVTCDWITVRGAAQHAKCGTRSIYLAVQQGKLRAARLGGRRELRFLRSWIDAWLLATSTPEIINRRAPGA
jgi:excisionase family DNA binding protein